MVPTTSSQNSNCSNNNATAPFLSKTYEMVDDPSTNHIVSWSETGTSFLVWNVNEFSQFLLPKYFKHSNFSSFIRQLNTYGFRKINPEQWEFATEGFFMGNKDALKSIRRRKPSAAQPNSTEPEQQRQPETATCTDPTHTGLLDHIKRLEHDKEILLRELLNLQQQQSYTESDLQLLGQRLQALERRQQQIVTFLGQVMRDPTCITQLVQQLEDHMLFQSKKRPKLLFSEETSNRIGETSSDHDVSGTLTTEKDGPPSMTTESRGDISSGAIPFNQTDDDSPLSLSSGGFPNTPTTDLSSHTITDTTISQCRTDRTDMMRPSNLIEQHTDYGPASNEDVSNEPENVAQKHPVSSKIEQGDKKAEGSRDNDGFWSKFLTESPSSTDAESDIEDDDKEDEEGTSLERQFF